MKVGVVFFHKNILNIYKESWINSCILSMRYQSFQPLYFYEVNYGDCDTQLVDGSKFFNKNFDNHSIAMNYIISKAFDDGCDFVFNTNMDDYYDTYRVEEQLPHLESGNDIVSSDFFIIDDKLSFENPLSGNILSYQNVSSNGSIRGNLIVKHNVIAHPSVSYSRKFWEDENNRYGENDIPEEDLILWTKSIHNGYDFFIVPEPLFFYRKHSNQICK
jgi:hypothetical protein